MLQLSGIASGIDTQSLVDTIVQAERAPRQSSLQRQQSADTVELSALGQLQSAINSFNSAIENLGKSEAFNDRLATVSNNSVLGVTVSDEAVAGSYSFTVQQLATNHQMATGPVDNDTAFGTGDLVLTVNGESLTISLDGSNNTLEGIRDAINQGDDNPGISATIINENGQQRLLLNGTRTGAANTISINTSALTIGAGEVDLGAGMTDLQVASDAEIVLGNPANPNSITITSSDNSIEGVVDGVTLNLKEVSSTPVTVDISLDKASSEQAVKGFVSAYNELMNTVNSLTQFTEGRGGSALTGDATVRSFLNSLRTSLSNGIEVNGKTLRLSNFGVQTTASGTLEIDSGKLSEAVGKNFSSLQIFFTGGSGFTSKLNSVLDSYDSSNGIIKTRMDRLDEGLKDITLELEELDVRMEAVSKYWQDRFLAMEQAMAQFNSTSSWLANNLNNLSSGNNDN